MRRSRRLNCGDVALSAIENLVGARMPLNCATLKGGDHRFDSMKRGDCFSVKVALRVAWWMASPCYWQIQAVPSCCSGLS